MILREMAIGNTFGATALSSYGGFWISFAIVLTPGGFNIESALVTADKGSTSMFDNSFGLFLMVSSSELVSVLCRRPQLTV
jgi:succinate-acetate transporter protein